MFLLQPRWSRLTLLLWILAVTLASIAAGAALTVLDNAGSDQSSNPVQGVVIAISVTIMFGGPVIGSLVVIGLIRQRAIVSTTAGLWIWSGRSDLYVEWKEIAGVAIVPAARSDGGDQRSDQASHWCPALTTHGGQQFTLTRYRARARSGQPREKSRCSFGADNVAAMVNFVTRVQMVPVRGEPSVQLRHHSRESSRALPSDATVLPLPGIVRRSAAKTVIVPLVAGGLIGIRISTSQNPPMGATATVVTLGASIAAMGLLLFMFIWLVYRELAWGASWMAWRLRVIGRWQIIPLERITRINVPVANPVRTRTISNRLAIAVRTDDGRTRFIRTVELTDSGEPLRRNLTALVNGPLAHVSTDRVREFLSSGVTIQAS